MKENSKIVFNYVKEHEAEDITAADITEATGLPVKSVNGIITSAFQKKGIMERVEADVVAEDGTKKTVKLIKLTNAYKDATVESIEAEAEAAKASK